MAEMGGLFWEQATGPLIAPILKLCVGACLGMSLMLFFERVYMAIVILFLKLSRKNPHKTYNWDPIKDDLELAHSAYPMVLVQIPMYNEKEVSSPLNLHFSSNGISRCLKSFEFNSSCFNILW